MSSLARGDITTSQWRESDFFILTKTVSEYKRKGGSGVNKTKNEATASLLKLTGQNIVDINERWS